MTKKLGKTKRTQKRKIVEAGRYDQDRKKREYRSSGAHWLP